jgi:hypothetical protein
MTVATRPALSVDDLENANIDADSFDHEAHVRLAWMYLEKYPVTEAIDLFSREGNVLNRYYCSDTLASDEARHRFVLPDRLVA